MPEELQGFFSYEGIAKGEAASFTVDLSLAERFDQLGDFTTLLYVTCLPVRVRKGGFHRRDLRNLDAVHRDILSLLGDAAVFAGRIDVPDQRWLYYYTNDAKLFLRLSEFCEKEGSLQLTCGRLDEPERETYYKTLYPDATRLQQVKNLALIEAMRKRGDDTEKSRRINLRLRFGSLPRMQEFCGRALEEGFAIGETDFDADSERPYGVTLHCIRPLSPAALEDLTNRIIPAAAEFDGRLRFLDCAFVERR